MATIPVLLAWCAIPLLRLARGRPVFFSAALSWPSHGLVVEAMGIVLCSAFANTTNNMSSSMDGIADIIVAPGSCVMALQGLLRPEWPCTFGTEDNCIA